MIRYILALALLGPLTVGCQARSSEQSSTTRAAIDTSAERAAIQQMSAQYQAAFHAGDSKGISSLYADDAVIYPANESPVRGRVALDAYFAANNGQPIDETLTTIDIVVSASGDMAYEVGQTMNSAGAGKYITIFRKVNGRWLIAADTWSHDTPPSLH